MNPKAPTVSGHPTKLNQGKGMRLSLEMKSGQTTVEYLVILLVMVGLLVAVAFFMSPRLRNMVKDMAAKIQCALDLGGSGGCGAPAGQASGLSGSPGAGGGTSGGGSSAGSGSPGGIGGFAGGSSPSGGSIPSSGSSSGGTGGSISGGGSSASSGSGAQGAGGTPPPPPPPPSNQVFNNPTVNGIALDHCLNYAKNCGKPSADSFCRSQGFSTATAYTEGANVTKTIVPNDGLICDSSKLGYAGCGPMASVTCTR